MAKILINDQPDNQCFGCSPHNARGLRLEFHEQSRGLIETPYRAPGHLCGAPGVIHGGVQAALLDETMGMAIQSQTGDEIDAVTVDFTLRYRRPAPTDSPLILRGRYLRSDDRDHYVEGQIVSDAGEVLTHAEARWRNIPARG